MDVVFEAVQGETVRDEVRTFMTEMLGERSGLQIPTIEEERLVGMSSLILTARWQGRLLAAVFASGDIEYSVYFWKVRRRLRLARLLRRRMVVVHQLAVDPGFRRCGLGRELLTSAIRFAADGDAWVATLNFDSTKSGLGDFYAAAGFTCLGPGELLGIKFRGLRKMIGMPLDSAVDTWAFTVIDGSRVVAGEVQQVKDRVRESRVPWRRAEHVPASREG